MSSSGAVASDAVGIVKACLADGATRQDSILLCIDLEIPDSVTDAKNRIGRCFHSIRGLPAPLSVEPVSNKESRNIYRVSIPAAWGVKETLGLAAMLKAAGLLEEALGMEMEPLTDNSRQSVSTLPFKNVEEFRAKLDDALLGKGAGRRTF